MTATLYIIKGADAYRLGADPVVRLWEPESISRTWIRRVTVDMPEGFRVADNAYDEPCIYRGGQQYELATDKNENPVIIDHLNSGAYINMDVLDEGWDET